MWAERPSQFKWIVRDKIMRKVLALIGIMAIALLLCACGVQRELADMESIDVNGMWCVVWEGRTYAPFCVVSKKDRGAQIGYVSGDKDNKISEYKEYPPEEWLVSWLPMDGGAMLLKEAGVTVIPEGLEKEY